MRALRFAGDVGEIGGEDLFPQAEAALAERGDPTDPRQQVALHQDVIGDGDDVEAPGLAVEIDDLAKGEAAVAPARVDVEVAEQKRFVAWHHNLTSTWLRSLGRRCSSSDVKLRTYKRNTAPFPIATKRRADVKR